MDTMLAANSYIMVIFSNMEHRNRVFEGGPYFYNQVGLFIKPCIHVLIYLKRFLLEFLFGFIYLAPQEFLREDILHKIASLLGKLVVVATQTLDKMMISFARICVKIGLNNLLSDSMEIFLGSSSWIQ